MQRGFTPIVIIILFALILGSYFVYQKQVKLSSDFSANPINKSSSIQSGSSSSTPTATSSPVSTYKLTPSPKTSTAPSASNTFYISRVKLDSVLPNLANFGEEIRLLGSGFGTITGRVYLYNQILGPNTVFAEVIPNRWTDTEIKITIPPATGGQAINVEVVHKDGTKSNRVQFQIKGGQPIIDVISPSNAQPLQEITISGKGFGIGNGVLYIIKNDQPDLTVAFALCDILSWGDTSVRCRLPSTVNNGTEYGFQIVTSDNRRSSFEYYKVGN